MNKIKYNDIKTKNFSTDKTENSKFLKDANAMTQLGKVGLRAVGLLGVGTGLGTYYLSGKVKNRKEKKDDN